MDIEEASESLRNFLDQSKTELVDNFIRLHTNGKPWSGPTDPNINPYSTIRDTKSMAFDWRNNIDDGDILETQRFCANSMNMLGYYPMENIQENKFNQTYILMSEKPSEFQESNINKQYYM